MFHIQNSYATEKFDAKEISKSSQAKLYTPNKVVNGDS